jgi:hypothetical protein
VYPVVFIDAPMVKIRDGVVANRPVYLAIGPTRSTVLCRAPTRPPATTPAQDERAQ